MPWPRHQYLAAPLLEARVEKSCADGVDGGVGHSYYLGYDEADVGSDAADMDFVHNEAEVSRNSLLALKSLSFQ